jgi:hypothetical protein
MYGILGLQLFQGSIYGRCRETPQPVNSTYWPISQHDNRPCNIYGLGIHKCPKDTVCGDPSQFGISREDDYIYNNPSLQYGISSFDNIFQSVLAVFQIITCDSWTTILFNLQDANNNVIATFYCCSIVLICSFFSLNLILAVIMENFQKHQKAEIEKQVREYE